MWFYDLDVGANERLREVLGAVMARPRGGGTLVPHQLPVQPQVATICTKENKQGGPSHREASASTSDAASPHGLPTL